MTGHDDYEREMMVGDTLDPDGCDWQAGQQVCSLRSGHGGNHAPVDPFVTVAPADREGYAYSEVTGRYGLPGTVTGPFCMASFLDRQAMYAGSTFMLASRAVHVVKLLYAVLEWREKPCTCGGCAAILAGILG